MPETETDELELLTPEEAADLVARHHELLCEVLAKAPEGMERAEAWNRLRNKYALGTLQFIDAVEHAKRCGRVREPIFGRLILIPKHPAIRQNEPCAG